MKIFQVTTFYHPVTGGVESHVANLSYYLKELGHDVTVLTSDATKVGYRIKNSERVYNGIEVKRFFTWFSISEYHKFFPGLFFYLLKSDFDIVHIHGFRKFETYLALLAAKIKKKKVVLTTHNPFPTTTRGRILTLLLKIHDKTIGRWFTKKINKIITILNSENKIFINKFNVPKEKIINVYNGINPIFLESGNKENFLKEYSIDLTKYKGLVVGGGRLNYAKGFQFLKKAVDSLPDILFFIAGGDDGYLNELLKIYKNNNNIIFNGKYISQDKIIDIYKAADIFVLPSIHEATGTMLMEALSQGCDIIATNQGGTIEYIGKNRGIFINPFDQDLWLKEINTLLKSKDKNRDNNIKEAHEFINKYTWDKLAIKIDKIYKKL